MQPLLALTVHSSSHITSGGGGGQGEGEGEEKKKRGSYASKSREERVKKDLCGVQAGEYGTRLFVLAVPGISVKCESLKREVGPCSSVWYKSQSGPPRPPRTCYCK